MPKSTSSLSPSNSHPNSKGASEDLNSRMSDVALRKKKNADAQAAFRARRANYIATLEETVTSLESVVLQLQDSCREARSEATELRQENARLRHDFREREKFWRALWQARKSGQSESDDLPPLPPSCSLVHGPSGNVGAHMGAQNINHYNNDGVPYRTTDDTSASVCSGPYHAGPSQSYSHNSPSLPYANAEVSHTSAPDHSSHSLNNHRGQKFGTYPYNYGSHREGPWSQSVSQSTSSGGESGGPTRNSSTSSPGFVESPTLTSSEMSYVGRFPHEEQKALNNLDTAPYVFPVSRSLSPSTSTPPSSSSTSLGSTAFHFAFQDGSSSQSRPNFDYHRQTHLPGAEVTLHGGSADISLASPGSDAVRYRLGGRRATTGERPLLPAMPTISGSDNGSQHERGSSEGDSTPYPTHSRLRPRRSTAPSRTSRSLSPDTPPISGTLAVIKAQAFGALRRTRVRPKKSSEGAAKVAMDVLEARGIGMGVGAGIKRPRLDSDEAELQE